MKDYYEILGVNRGASEAEIKRAYRRLVVKYHPDKNREASAHDQIREINEAYEVLGDVEKRRAYDLGQYKPLIDTFTVADEPPMHRDPAYRRRRPMANPPNKPTMRELIEKYLPFFIKISMAAFGFCMLLIVDYSLPFRSSMEKVIDKYLYEGGYYSGKSTSLISTVIVTNEDNHYRLPDVAPSDVSVGDLILVSSSRLFHVPISVQWSDYRGEFKPTIYRNFLFLPIIMLVTSSFGVFLKRYVELRFNLAIVSGILLILNVFLLFASKMFV